MYLDSEFMPGGVGPVGLEGCGKELRICSAHPEFSAGDTGVCREAALSPMDAGWGLEVGELLLVSPTGQ